MILLKTLKKIFFGTYARGFVTSYFLFLMIGATLLRLPISLQDGQSLSWLDAMFTSASGLSTTGLSTIVVKDVLTRFGQTVLILIIQFGGIGLIMMVALFWLAIRKKISFSERNMIMTDQNQLSRQGVVRFVRNVLIMIFSIEFIGIVIMSGYLIIFTDHFTIGEAIYQSFFNVISLFTNAGFDIAPGGDSFQMYANDYFIQSLAMTLMFLGAVGFWPLYELKGFIMAKFRGESYEFGMFSKMLFMLHLGIWLISALLLFGIEYNGFLADKSFFEGLYYTLFMSLTTRNAGFSTMDVNQFTGTTQAFFAVLMFIGSSPNSAGGGIRTTTLLLTVLGIRAFARGRDAVVMNSRRIKQETVYKSFIVIFVAAAFIVSTIIILTMTENFPASSIAFEVASAFGTTGLSLGITSSLTTFGRAMIVLVMFVGRVGILALLLMFKPKTKTTGNITYPEIDIIVG